MTVHLYTLCWNEADMLGFFFRHYDPWVDRYVVFDDGSTDGSTELLDAHPRVERRRFDRGDRASFVAAQMAMQNEAWKQSRGEADWVVVSAIDEHLWSPVEPVPELLARLTTEGVTAVPALGFQMISEKFPEPDELLCATRTDGAPWAVMSKLSLFRPEAIAETRFEAGRHRAAPVGEVVYPQRDELLLLHYKYIGFERLLGRQALLRSGLGEADEEMRWGEQYGWDEAQIRADWDAFAGRAVDVAASGLDLDAGHPDDRWWREPLRLRS